MELAVKAAEKLFRDLAIENPLEAAHKAVEPLDLSSTSHGHLMTLEDSHIAARAVPIHAHGPLPYDFKPSEATLRLNPAISATAAASKSSGGSGGGGWD